MLSASRGRIFAVGAAFALWVQCVSSSSLSAVQIAPSDNWYGVDGTWSTITIGVGTESPRKWMDVMVSTVSSETWVVGAGGCGNSSNPGVGPMNVVFFASGRLVPQNTLYPGCLQDRGGQIFYPYNSSSWDPVGRYSLGADRELGNHGYADYGLDTLTVGVGGPNVTSSIIGAFNGTDTINNTYYITGLFGLGLGTGTFNNDITPVPALNALVKIEGKVPGNSYGFTAGAHYQQGGEPTSLTLGGYDASRLAWHNVTFALNAAKLPQTFIQGISIFSAMVSSNFTNSAALLTTADRVNAIIDSSTPYLWLPPSVCDKFATALGLVYDNAINLYTFGGNESNHDALDKSQLSFNFTLSDLDSKGDIINIVIPYKAFDLQLRYPAIPNTTYGAANSTRNYFPLRKSSNDAQYRIGRAFLQEAYIVTDYDRSLFGVYQAIHPSNPFGSVNLITIEPPPTSLFGEVPSSNTKNSFPIGAIVGLVIGTIFLIVLMIFSVLFIFHRRRTLKADDESVIMSIGARPRTFLDRFRSRPCETFVHEASGSTNYPTEVGADATHERFELPAPLGPAELDSDSGTLEGTTENGTQDSADLSAYERARRKLERQQLAAMAEQLQISHETYPVEKNDTDISPIAHYRPSDLESLLVSPICGEESPTIDDQPSPVSPGFISPPSSPMSPPSGTPPMYTRINPLHVVYAGRLPDNVQLPVIVPRVIGPDGQTIRTIESSITDTTGTNSSLGSRFTERESEDLYGSGNTNIVSPIASGSSVSGRSGSISTGTNIVSPIASNSTRSGDSRGFHIRGGSEIETDRTLNRSNTVPDEWPSRRRLGGTDLVHVPQPAENRFSWEEEKISGREKEVEEQEEGSL